MQNKPTKNNSAMQINALILAAREDMQGKIIQYVTSYNAMYKQYYVNELIKNTIVKNIDSVIDLILSSNIKLTSLASLWAFELELVLQNKEAILHCKLHHNLNCQEIGDRSSAVYLLFVTNKIPVLRFLDAGATLHNLHLIAKKDMGLLRYMSENIEKSIKLLTGDAKQRVSQIALPVLAVIGFKNKIAFQLFIDYQKELHQCMAQGVKFRNLFCLIEKECTNLKALLKHFNIVCMLEEEKNIPIDKFIDLGASTQRALHKLLSNIESDAAQHWIQEKEAINCF